MSQLTIATRAAERAQQKLEESSADWPADTLVRAASDCDAAADLLRNCANRLRERAAEAT